MRGMLGRGLLFCGLAMVCCSLSGLLPLCERLVAEDAGAAGEQQLAARRYAYFKAQAAAFRARLSDGASVELAGDSILNWTIDQAWHGSIFIWTANDRPVLVGCFLADSERPNQRRTMAEFHQLTADRLERVRFNGIRPYLWEPDAKKSVMLPTETSVGTSARTRLLEMRTLARELSVTMHSDDERSHEQLRLLTQPLYRYSDQNPETDGALFGFVTTRGTDPEFIVAIEATKNSSGTYWSLRPMRSCTRRLELTRGGIDLWSVPKYDLSTERLRHGDPYVIVTLTQSNVADFEALLDTAANEGPIVAPMIDSEAP